MNARLINRDFPERLQAKATHPLIALVSALTVFGAAEFTFGFGDANDNPDSIGQLDGVARQVSAIQQQRAAFLSGARDALIEDAAVHADELILGTLTKQRFLRRIKCPA